MKEEKNPFVLSPMCNCNNSPVKLSLQVRKATGPWKMPDKMAGKTEGSSENIPWRPAVGCRRRVRAPIHHKELGTPRYSPHHSSSSQQQRVTGTTAKSALSLRSPLYFSILPSQKGKEEGGQYTQPCTSCPIPLDVDGEFSKAVSTSHHTGDFSFHRCVLPLSEWYSALGIHNNLQHGVPPCHSHDGSPNRAVLCCWTPGTEQINSKQRWNRLFQIKVRKL